MEDNQRPNHLFFVEELKKQWLAMIDTIQDPLVLIDKNHQIIRHNKAYFDLCQKPGSRTLKGMKDSKCYEVFANRSSPCLQCSAFSAQANKDSKWITKQLMDGKVLEVRSHTLRSDLEDEFTANDDLYVVHYRDVTDQIQIQETLAQAEKLAALGKLAGGIAHEINSPLAGILAFSQVLLSELSQEDPHRDDVLQIEDAAKRCKAIVENMLGFARQNKTVEKTNFNLVETLQQTLHLANPILKNFKIFTDLIWEGNSSDYFIFGHPGKMGQVFMNLITNAAYAMKVGGGTLNIRFKNLEHHFLMEFEDFGCGIKPELLGKIFDPFFTTKPVGEGTGLGLSISYSILKQHSGEIKVESKMGEGSVFVLTLPKLISSESGDKDFSEESVF